MKRKESPINKVVAADKKVVEIRSNVHKQMMEEKSGFSNVENSENLKEALSKINSLMGKFLSKYGVETTDFPENRLLVAGNVTHEQLQEKLESDKKRKVGGFFTPAQLLIVLNREENFNTDEDGNLFIQCLIHEVLHANSFNSVVVTKEKSENAYLTINLVRENDNGVRYKEIWYQDVRRMGFNIVTKVGQQFFNDIDEAIITEMQIRFFFEHGGEFENCKSSWEKIIGHYKYVSDKEGKQAADEIRSRLSFVEEEKHNDGTTTVKVVLRWPYEKQRKDLWDLINDLFLQNQFNSETQEGFKDKEEIFDLFVKASFKGELLPIARLVEKTYGKDMFRYLGEVTQKD